MRRFIIIAVSVLFLAACGNNKSSDRTSSSNDTLVKNDSGSAMTEVQNVDKEFESCIKDNGPKEAFEKYLSNDGVLLKANHAPIVSRDSVVAFFTKKKFTNIKYSRKSLSFEMSGSNDIAYAYGTYEMSAKGGKGNLVTSNGCFCCIWKKNSENIWEIALECENEGLVPVKKQK